MTTEYIPVVPARLITAEKYPGQVHYLLMTEPGACPYCCVRPTHRRSHWYWQGSVMNGKMPKSTEAFLTTCPTRGGIFLVMPETDG